MAEHIDHVNKRKYYRIGLDIAKEGDEVFNLTEYFKARMGDRNVPLLVTFYQQGSLMNVKGLKPFIQGNVGHYSFDEDGKIVMADDAAVVSYTGTTNDTDYAGHVTYIFPEQMFPKEGIFYGLIGLVDDETGQKVTSVDVWFKVYKGIAYLGKASNYYLSDLEQLKANYEEKIRQALLTAQGDFDAKAQALQTVLDDYKKQATDLIDKLNAQGQTTNAMMETVKAALTELQTKIQQDGLFTQAEAKAFEEELKKEIENLIVQQFDEYNLVGRNYSYVQDYGVDGSATDLKKMADDLDQSKFNALFLTDMHATDRLNDNDDGYNNGGHHVTEMLKNMGVFDGKVDAVLVNGDNIHGNEYNANWYPGPVTINSIRNRQIANLTNDIFTKTDVFPNIGNHDNGSVQTSYSKLVIAPQELEEDWGVNQKLNGGEIRDKFFAYKQYDDKKICIITLNTYENPYLVGQDGNVKYPTGLISIIADKQIQDLVKALQSVPDNYHVLISTHVPFEGFFNNAPYKGGTNINHDVVKKVLSAFATHGVVNSTGSSSDFPTTVSADFRQNKGILIGVVVGHEHNDLAAESHEGLTEIMRTCFIPCYPSRPLGTKNQYAFDVIQIDHDQRIITFKRYGMGDDYSYGY